MSSMMTHSRSLTLCVCVSMCCFGRGVMIHIQTLQDSINPSAPPSAERNLLSLPCSEAASVCMCWRRVHAHTFKHKQPVIYNKGTREKKAHAMFLSAHLDDNWSWIQTISLMANEIQRGHKQYAHTPPDSLSHAISACLFSTTYD